MTFLANPKAQILSDVLEFNLTTTLNVGSVWTLSTSPVHTSATVDSSGYLVLDLTSNWFIEANPLVSFSSLSTTWSFEVYWYNGSTNLGQYGRTSQVSDLNVSRGSCSAFIPASSGTLTVYPRASSVSGTPKYYSSYTPIPSCKIFEVK